MSADNITECPRCHEYRLREWYDLGVMRATDDEPAHFYVYYHCLCRECDYEYQYEEKIYDENLALDE